MSDSSKAEQEKTPAPQTGKKPAGRKAKSTPESDFLIVGIGASAGGVTALASFFEHLPAEEKGIAYVVVTHLSPEHESSLDAIIQNYTDMPVIKVTEPVPIKSNTVFVITPGKQLAMEDGYIRLTDMEKPRIRRAPIDLFFRTLAESHREKAVAVVLSGTGSDGSTGLASVKEAGGLTLVQEPDEAEYNQMPNTAIGTGFVDKILSAAKMGEWLQTYNKNRVRINLEPQATVTIEETEKEEPTKSDVLLEILARLRARTGHDFSLYKRATLRRRVERRMQVNNLTELSDYLNFLATNPGELQALMRDLLISVTNFFRDKSVWDYLETTVIPYIFREKTRTNNEVRVWVAGCATGEEAYSLAILLQEYTNKQGLNCRLQIFATDLDERSISIAREGSYPETIALDISEERLKTYFTFTGHRYQVRKEIRDKILFAVHDLLKDPPFSRLDLVSCRNLMIYLNKEAQDQVLALFHFALKPEAYLVLGTSETADGSSQLFTSFDKKHHIYTRRTVPYYAQPIPVRTGKESTGEMLNITNLPVSTNKEKMILPANLHQNMLEMLAPPSVVVDENFDIVHLSNEAGRYLQFSGGEPSINLLRVIHPDLRLDLRSGLYRATQQRKSNESRRIRFNGQDRLVRLTIHPVQEMEGLHGYLLVIFDEVSEVADEEATVPQEGEEVENTSLNTANRDTIISQLEEEIDVLKSQLRLTVEQYETSVEELKASNEELRAINEELRSASEELETSKEEIQAVNEELLTVNQELKVKVEEVSHSNSDLQNLINSTDIATLFLSRQLRVKRYTPRVEHIFNIIPTDIDRPLSHLTNRLKYANLVEDCEAILQNLTPIIREVESAAGEWYLMRLLPYRTLEDRIDGVVLTFTDISERKQATEKLRESQERLDSAFTTATMASWDWDPESDRLIVSDSISEVYGLLPGENFESRAYGFKLVHPDDVATYRAIVEQAVERGEGWNTDFRIIRPRDGKVAWLEERARTSQDPQTAKIYITSLIWDITERKHAEEALRQSAQNLSGVANIVPELLWYSEPDGSTGWYNDRWLEYTGQTYEQAVGWGWTEAIHPEDRETSAYRYRQAVEQSQYLQQEHRIRRHDGEYRWFLVRAAPLFNEQKQLIRMYGAATDIHEQKMAQVELERRVTERTASLADTNKTLQQERQQLRDLSLRLLDVQETERRRLALELHDEIGQHLTGLKFLLEEFNRQPGAPVAKIIDQVNELTQQVRDLSLTLRPSILDDLGLLPALSWLTNRFTEQTGIKVAVYQDGLDKRLPQSIETTLFRIIQEGLTNVARHSGATEVKIQLLVGDKITCFVQDNGKGFDVSRLQSPYSSTGISSIRERVELVDGTFAVESEPGYGTQLIIEIPYSPDNPAI